MPRNSNGEYTLVAGNPVSAGTVIAATWANSTLNDISWEITDSLSRTGKGPMLAPLILWGSPPTYPNEAVPKSYVDGSLAGTIGTGYLPLTGGTLTGTLKIEKVSSDVVIEINGSPGYSKGLFMETNGVVRWKVLSHLSADDPFVIERFNDAGVYQGAVISIDRATGISEFKQPVKLSNPGWNSLRIYNPNAPAGKRGAAIGVDDPGYVCFRAFNDDYTVERGNIYFAHDSLEWQVATATKGGGKIWHQGNDGQNSGLDADLLRSFYPSWDNVGNTVVLRRDTGRIDCGQVVCSSSLWVNGLEFWNESGKWRTANPIHTSSYARVEDAFYCRDIYWNNNANQWQTYWNVITGAEMQCEYFRCRPEIQIREGSGNKYIRASGNNFEIVNNPYNAVILQLTDSGRLWTQQGYLSKAGMYGGVGANVHNWYWDGNVQIWVDNTRVGWITVSNSDERIKKDIELMPLLPAEVFNKIVPIKFRWLDVGIFIDDGKDHWGFSAQNLLQHMPQAVRGNVEEVGEDGAIYPAAVDEMAILAQTILQVQQLTAQVKELQRAQQ